MLKIWWSWDGYPCTGKNTSLYWDFPQRDMILTQFFQNTLPLAPQILNKLRSKSPVKPFWKLEGFCLMDNPFPEEAWRNAFQYTSKPNMGSFCWKHILLYNLNWYIHIVYYLSVKSTNVSSVRLVNMVPVGLTGLTTNTPFTFSPWNCPVIFTGMRVMLLIEGFINAHW